MKTTQKNKHKRHKLIWWVIGAIVLAGLMTVTLRRDDSSDLILQRSGPRMLLYQGNGYQIRYPDDWQLDASEQEAPAIIFSSPNKKAKLYIQSQYDPIMTSGSGKTALIKNLTDATTQSPDYTITSTEGTEVNGTPAYLMEGTFIDQGKQLEFREYTIFGDDGYFYSLRINNEPGEYQKAVEVMVSSFTITAPNQDEVKARELVESLIEVQNFKKLVEDGDRSTFGIRADRTPTTEEPYYVVQVYETFPDHTTTFNWYRVSPDTWNIERQDLVTDTWEKVN